MGRRTKAQPLPGFEKKEPSAPEAAIEPASPEASPDLPPVDAQSPLFDEEQPILEPEASTPPKVDVNRVIGKMRKFL